MLLAAEASVVRQSSRRFAPAAVNIPRGSTLHIENNDNVTHHVYVDSPEMSFDSGEQPVGATVDVPFKSPGLFSVRCAIHPTMRLQVTVE